MTNIVKSVSINGQVVPFGGGGGSEGAEVVYLTQAEYDALPASKLTDGKIYKVKTTGVPGGVLTAGAGIDITNNTISADMSTAVYDNTTSGLTATDVQDALDEINEKIEVIQYSTIPTAASENVGKIIQYTGTTTQTYTNGYFYKCVSDGQDTETFSREQVNVQPGGSVGNYLEKVTIMPAVVEETALNTTLMYVGNDTDKYKAGHIYTVKIKEIEEHFFGMGYSSASYVLAKKSTLSIGDPCWYLYDNQGGTPGEYYLPDVVVQSQTDNNLYPSAKLDDSNYKIADDYQGGYTSSYFKDFYENIDIEESLNAKLDVKDEMPVFQVSDYNNNTTFVLRNHQSGSKLTRGATYTVGITEDVVPNDFTYYVSSSGEYFDYYFNKANPTIGDTCYVRHSGGEALLKCKLVAFGDDRVIADGFETDSDAELYTPVTPYDQEYTPDGRVYGWVEVGKEKGAIMFKDFPYAYFMEYNETRLSLQTYLGQVKAGHLYQKDTKTLSNIYAYNNGNYYTDTSTPTDDTHVYIKVGQNFSQIPARIKNNTIYWAYGLQVGASRSSSKDETDAYVYYYKDVTETPTASTTSYDNTTSGLTATNVQDAMDEVFQSVSNGKELIADAITDKGVQTSASDSFQTMASNIESIVSAGSYGKVLAVGGRTTPNNVTVGEYSGKYSDTDYTIFFNTYVSQSSGSVYSFDGIMYVVEKSTGKIYSGYGGGDVSRENSRGNVYTSLLDCGDYFTVQACNDENGSMFGRYGALKFDKTTKEITFHVSAFDDYTTLSPLHNNPKTTTTYNDGRMSGIMRNTDLGIDTDEYKNRLYYSASHDTNYNHNFNGSVIELF